MSNLTVSQALGPVIEKLTETVWVPDRDESGKPTFIKKRWDAKARAAFMEWLDGYLNDRSVARAFSGRTPPRGSWANKVTKEFRRKLASEMDFAYFPIDEVP